MGTIRKLSKHVRWTERETEIVLLNYSHSTDNKMIALLPNRSVSQVQNKANQLGIVKAKTPRTLEQIREAKRLYMETKRRENPELARRRQMDFYLRNRDSQTARMRDYSARRFFWRRAMKLRGSDRAKTKEISSLWKRQKGICALTGRKLDRTAQLDHILPKARGGGDSISNLRWVCEQVNIIKRHLTDEEFLTACKDVVRHFGKRIELIDSIPFDTHQGNP